MDECQHTKAVLLRYWSHRVTAVCDDCREHWTGPVQDMPGWVQDVVHDYVMAAQLMFDPNDNSAIQLYLKSKLEKARRALAGGYPLDALDRNTQFIR